MTTYTITEAQRQQFLCAIMSKTDDQCGYAADVLQSLQPSTQKPLTVQEVEQILAQHDYELHGDRARYIVRMTEQAHGVKP